MKTFKGIIRVIIAFGLIFSLLFANLALVHAEESSETSKETTEKKIPVQESSTQKNQQFILQLKNQLQNARNDYFQIDKNVDEAKVRLLDTGDRITTLKGQLQQFDYLITLAHTKIKNVEKQIAQKQNLIGNYKQEIDIKRIELENQKLLLRDYLKILYLQENSFLSKDGDSDLSASKLLLGDANISDTFKKIEYYTILEQTGQNIFNKLETTKKEYTDARVVLQKTRQKLTKLNAQLDDEKKTMLVQRNAKDKLLRQTKGEEDIYRELIAQSKREQLELIEEINKLKENLAFIEQKIEEDGESFNPDDYQDLIHPNVRAVYDFEMLGDFATGERLNWPIDPSRGISAYFRDPSYYAVFGIPHSAIDIPIPQGTPVRAPSAGVVYKIKDNGDTNYAYIILAHKGGLLTVYGHMYEIMIDERDVVLPGEVIGLSGGIPGTKGAGYLTTGAHLHFEVIKSGKHINPLFVLDLDKLPEEYVPDYLKDEEEEAEVESEQ
ncbi:murein hydrolase activator EnvC family protein [Patescibacteria group bacterium]